MDVVEAAPEPQPVTTPSSGPPVWDRTGKLAAWVFAAFIAVAALLLLFHFGTHRWFHGDEWDYLADRDGGSIGDWLRPHNEHLTALPVVAYRVMWNLFGLRYYQPYQVPVITLHLTTAVLLRAIMRRCGVHPWIATAAAAVFVLFGPGEDNIVWAFQIGFTGSLAFGLGHLLLADHPGDIDRRDWLGVGVGFLGLLCSGLTPLTTGVVGIVVLVRRGWKPAAFNVVPIAIAYLTWWLTIGPDVVSNPYGDQSLQIGRVVDFARDALVATFEGIAAGSALLALALTILVIVGLVVAYAPLRGRERIRAAVMPVSLLGAGIAFAFISAYGRWWFGGGDSSRYIHLIAAFSLPAIAVAADALARHWRFGVPFAALLFVAVIPYGASQFDTNELFNGPYFHARRELITSLAYSKYIDEVPRSTRPDPTWANQITAGWLLDARKAGDLPPLDDRARADNPILRLRFGLAVIRAPGPRNRCQRLRRTTDVVLDKGDELGIYVAPHAPWPPGFVPWYNIRLVDQGKPVPGQLRVHPRLGHLLRAQLDDLHLRFEPSPDSSLLLCR